MSGPIAGIIVLASMALLLWASFRFVLWLDRAGEASLRRILEKAAAQAASDTSPLVNLSFCAYRSCLAYWVQSHYRISLPYDTAVALLRSLHNYTLRWAWLGPAAIIIPWSFLTYGIERYRLRRQTISGIRRDGPSLLNGQETAVFAPLLNIPGDDEDVEPAADSGSRSMFRVTFGCICLVLALLFAVVAIDSAMKSDARAGLGGAIAAMVLAWTGYSWIQKRS